MSLHQDWGARRRGMAGEPTGQAAPSDGGRAAPGTRIPGWPARARAEGQRVGGWAGAGVRAEASAEVRRRCNRTPPHPPRPAAARATRAGGYEPIRSGRLPLPAAAALAAPPPSQGRGRLRGTVAPRAAQGSRRRVFRVPHGAVGLMECSLSLCHSSAPPPSLSALGFVSPSLSLSLPLPLPPSGHDWNRTVRAQLRRGGGRAAGAIRDATATAERPFLFERDMRPM